MRCEVIPFSDTLWEALAPVWKTLGASDASAFLSVEWVGAWLAAFGPERRPEGLVWRDADGMAVGCALLSVGAARLGPFPVTRAYLNASGVGLGCEHNDVLTVPEHRAAVLDDLVRRVIDEGVDELALVGVREDLWHELGARWPGGLHEGHSSESPFVNLELIRQGGESYLSSLSANTRSQIRRALRLYEDWFGEPQVSNAGSADETRDWFDGLVTLHAERWRERGETGAFADPSIRGFHADLLEGATGPAAPGCFTPEILRVRFGTEVIAYLYYLRYRGRVNLFQSGLAFHDDNRLKPGLVAHALAIKHYLHLGEVEYDFLGGEPDAVRYKRSLATDTRMLAWVELPSPTSKMRVLRGLRVARRRAWSVFRRAHSALDCDSPMSFERKHGPAAISPSEGLE